MVHPRDGRGDYQVLWCHLNLGCRSIIGVLIWDLSCPFTFIFSKSSPFFLTVFIWANTVSVWAYGI